MQLKNKKTKKFAGGSERYKRNRKRKGRAEVQARWVLVMDEKKVQRETQTKKQEEYLPFSSESQSVLRKLKYY